MEHQNNSESTKHSSLFTFDKPKKSIPENNVCKVCDKKINANQNLFGMHKKCIKSEKKSNKK